MWRVCVCVCLLRSNLFIKLKIEIYKVLTINIVNVYVPVAYVKR